MYRVKRLYILAGVLALTCAAAVWALHQEERQEQIASSGETVLEIDPDTVRSLSWDCLLYTSQKMGLPVLWLQQALYNSWMVVRMKRLLPVLWRWKIFWV